MRRSGHWCFRQSVGTRKTSFPVHAPVLLDEVVKALMPRPDGRYVDCTYGRGGHSRAILEQLGEDGRVLALDRDPEAVAAGRVHMRADYRLTVLQAEFTTLQDKVAERGWSGEVDGVLFDLGLSSPQLDNPERGFSLRQDGPLDMRMNPCSGPAAAQWLAESDETEIRRVLRDYGEERFAGRIARHIVKVRAQGAIDTTSGLAEAVVAALPAEARRSRKRHPATRAFQAIRIQVNGELGQLEGVLPQTSLVLKVGGRLAIISFHSLEDRLVKRFLRGPVEGGLPRGLPVRGDQRMLRMWRIPGKAQRPSSVEQAANPRARSAVLRVAERAH